MFLNLVPLGAWTHVPEYVQGFMLSCFFYLQLVIFIKQESANFSVSVIDGLMIYE